MPVIGRSGLRAVQVATLQSGQFVPAGWVGAGLSEKACKEGRAALDAGKPVVIDVEFRGWTTAGELRHAVFKGLARRRTLGVQSVIDPMRRVCV